MSLNVICFSFIAECQGDGRIQHFSVLLDFESMPTSWNTHDYDGKLRDKWFQMRPILIEKYLPNCLSFTDTIRQIEEWLDKKYYNVKRIGRARRSIRILTSQRQSNFDSRNDIDVEELLPILWDKVKNQEDIHDTFYEQLCDITGGSCSQGRSTRLFQFLFLFDLPTNTEEESEKTTTENPPSTSKQQDKSKPDEPKTSEEEVQPSVEENADQEQHSPAVDGDQTVSVEENVDQRQQSPVDEKAEDEQQSKTE
jgi:hypothetical protein